MNGSGYSSNPLDGSLTYDEPSIMREPTLKEMREAEQDKIKYKALAKSIKEYGRARKSGMDGEGFLGMKSVAEAQASAKRREEREREAYAKLTPQQKLESFRRYEKEKNKSIGQKMGDSFSKPFTKKRGLMSLF
jgi:hypothetical protein